MHPRPRPNRDSIRKRISRIAAKSFLIYFALLALLFRRISLADFVRLITEAREGADPEDLEYELEDAMYTKVENTIEAMGDAWEQLSDWFQSLGLVSRIGVFLLGLLAFLIAAAILFFWFRWSYG